MDNYQTPSRRREDSVFKTIRMASQSFVFVLRSALPNIGFPFNAQPIGAAEPFNMYPLSIKHVEYLNPQRWYKNSLFP